MRKLKRRIAVSKSALPETTKDACLSDDGKYRWWLSREWEHGDGTCVFVMLNPSTADALEDDATIRRCVGFAEREGCNKLVVVNLFSYRTTYPVQLLNARHPIGEHNEQHLIEAVEQADVLIVAWGNDGGFEERDQEVMKLLRDHAPVDVHCLGTTGAGFPKHPLRLRKDTPLEVYEGRDDF